MTANGRFRGFAEARQFVRSLGLRNQREWFAWCKENRPPDIPYRPERTYSDSGSWRGWRDWLGTEHLTYAHYDRDRELGLLLQHLSHSKSQTTHARFKADPDKWWRFHAMFLKSRNRWTEDPIHYLAGRIKRQVPPAQAGARLADLGCGLSLLSVALPEYDVTGVDHIAYEPDIACDMAQTPFEDSSFDVAVFCLSLLGSNWPDYLSEARRILRPGGRLFVVESPKRWERMNIKAILEGKRFTHVRVHKRSSRQSSDFVYAIAKLARKEQMS